jgi:DNA-binding transcriptional LysR family regulator
LFYRRQRGLVLTAKGDILFKSARKAIGLIKNTLRSIENQTMEGDLTIATPPSVASMWLIPRLPEFTRQYPEINLNIVADLTMADFETGQHSLKAAGIDIAFFHRIIDSDEFYQERLIDDYLYPVCSPHLEKLNSIKTPEDLTQFPILCEAYPKMDFSADWELWSAGVGLKKFETRVRHVFNRLDLMIQAAVLGQGIALGRHSLVKRDIEASRLVKVLDRVKTTSYYLATLKELKQNPRLTAFMEWIKTTID